VAFLKICHSGDKVCPTNGVRLIIKYFELLNYQADRMSVLSRIGNMSKEIFWKYGKVTIHSDLQKASEYRRELR